jgi:hypothetical protein
MPDVDSNFIVVSNADKINRFMVETGDEGEEGLSFSLSHDVLKFTLYKTPYTSESNPVRFSEYQLGYLDN